MAMAKGKLSEGERRRGEEEEEEEKIIRSV